MKPAIFARRAAHIIKYIDRIWNQPPIYFSNLTPSMLRKIGAVYLIAHKETNEVLYIGRTVNLQRRLYTNHLMGNKSTARLKKYLIEDPDLPTVETYEDAKRYLQDNCYFKYIKVTNWKLRGYIEGMLAYPLKVRYIEKEH